MKKFLIGMLASGENEKDEALASIKSQSLQDYDLVVIEGLKNKEAHDALYSLFNEKAEEYEVFLKHDADMVFSTSAVLDGIYEIFKKNSHLDHILMDVKDWYSNLMIPGQNAYRNTVRWHGNEDDLIVDYHGNFGGKSARIKKTPVPYTLHSPNPSGFGAFSFGFHRGAKVRQQGRVKDFGRALLHYTILQHVWLSYKSRGDIRRLYALWGAEMAFSASPVATGGYKSKYWEEYFTENVKPFSEMSLLSRVEELWEAAVSNSERWLLR